MKHIIKSRLGIALESAILFMLTLSALSILLITVVLSAQYAATASDRQTAARLELDQLGEYFVSGMNETELQSKTDKYTCDIDDVNNTLTLTRSGKVALYIKLDGQEVIKWQYSAPSNLTE